MKKIITIISGLLFSLPFLNAQDVEQSGKSLVPQLRIAKDVNVQFGGFVRAEYLIDSREVVGYVDDLFGLFPKNEKIENGVDVNKQVNQSLSTQATRFNALLTAPDVLGAKSYAFFEFDFTGGNRINTRLRHAWLKLAWQKGEILFGKTWNPLAETVFPSVAGLHTGIPFRPFGRSDQLRFTYKPVKELSVLLAASYQTEHTSTFIGDATLRNGIVTPDFHLQLRYQNQAFGAGLLSEFKVIRPTGSKKDNTLSSYSFGAYADYKANLFNIKGSIIYSQNLSDLFAAGGYAVKSVDADGKKSFTPSNGLSYWLNFTYGRVWQVGLFAGYQHNLGYSDNIEANGDRVFYGKYGDDIDRIYRVAPSLTYRVGQWAFQAEVDYNVADYGTPDYADKGKVKDTKAVSAVRGLFVTTFFY